MIKLIKFLAFLICFQIGNAFFSGSLKAQNFQTSELGIGLGGMVYKGEVAPEYRLTNNMPAVHAFYRYDISAPLTLKANLLFGSFAANDEDIELRLHQLRRAEVSGSLMELSAGLEYNFLDYYDFKRQTRWAPYFFISSAVFLMSSSVETPIEGLDGDNSVFSLSVPVGVGIKYALNKHWNLGFETGPRKTFTDLFDNLDGRDEQRGYSNHHNKDWYFHTGFSISYTFYKLICADVYKAKPSPLD